MTLHFECVFNRILVESLNRINLLANLGIALTMSAEERDPPETAQITRYRAFTVLLDNLGLKILGRTYDKSISIDQNNTKLMSECYRS